MSNWHWKVRERFVGIVRKEIVPNDFLKEYRSLVDEIVYCRNRLKNPVNLKNGKPLAQSTILGFESRIDSLKSEIRHYRVVFKLLRLFGYFGGHQAELSTDQQVLKCLLGDYVFDEKMLEKCRKEHRHEGYWKEKAGYYKARAEFLESESNRWADLCKYWYNIATGESDKKPEEPQEREQPKRQCKIYPFNVVDGGKKFEEQPPFAD